MKKFLAFLIFVLLFSCAFASIFKEKANVLSTPEVQEFDLVYEDGDKFEGVKVDAPLIPGGLGALAAVGYRKGADPAINTYYKMRNLYGKIKAPGIVDALMEQEGYRLNAIGEYLGKKSVDAAAVMRNTTTQYNIMKEIGSDFKQIGYTLKVGKQAGIVIKDGADAVVFKTKYALVNSADDFVKVFSSADGVAIDARILSTASKVNKEILKGVRTHDVSRLNELLSSYADDLVIVTDLENEAFTYRRITENAQTALFNAKTSFSSAGRTVTSLTQKVEAAKMTVSQAEEALNNARSFWDWVAWRKPVKFLSAEADLVRAKRALKTAEDSLSSSKSVYGIAETAVNKAKRVWDVSKTKMEEAYKLSHIAQAEHAVPKTKLIDALRKSATRGADSAKVDDLIGAIQRGDDLPTGIFDDIFPVIGAVDDVPVARAGLLSRIAGKTKNLVGRGTGWIDDVLRNYPSGAASGIGRAAKYVWSGVKGAGVKLGTTFPRTASVLGAGGKVLKFAGKGIFKVLSFLGSAIVQVPLLTTRFTHLSACGGYHNYFGLMEKAEKQILLPEIKIENVKKYSNGNFLTYYVNVHDQSNYHGLIKCVKELYRMDVPETEEQGWLSWAFFGIVDLVDLSSLGQWLLLESSEKKFLKECSIGIYKKGSEGKAILIETLDCSINKQYMEQNHPEISKKIFAEGEEPVLKLNEDIEFYNNIKLSSSLPDGDYTAVMFLDLEDNMKDFFEVGYLDKLKEWKHGKSDFERAYNSKLKSAYRFMEKYDESDSSQTTFDLFKEYGVISDPYLFRVKKGSITMLSEEDLVEKIEESSEEEKPEEEKTPAEEESEESTPEESTEEKTPPVEEKKYEATNVFEALRNLNQKLLDDLFVIVEDK